MNISLRKRSSFLFPLLVALCACFSLTSCEDDDYYWDPPASGFIDGDLVGVWALAQIDGNVIAPVNANYFSFAPSGRGRFYYMDRGRRYIDDIYYWSEYGSYGKTWLYIQYPGGSIDEQSYWFSDGARSLWMQFEDGYGRVTTYRYEYINRPPW